MTVVSLVPSGFYQFTRRRDGMCTRAALRLPPVKSFAPWPDAHCSDLIFASGAILMLVFVIRAVLLTVRKPEGSKSWTQTNKEHTGLPLAKPVELGELVPIRTVRWVSRTLVKKSGAR